MIVFKKYHNTVTVSRLSTIDYSTIWKAEETKRGNVYKSSVMKLLKSDEYKNNFLPSNEV